MEFDWDDAKAEINRRKHGLTFGTAIAVFLDPKRVVAETIRLEDGEDRLKVIGEIDSRLFTVVFVVREDTYRLISARRSNRSEERTYGARHARSE